MAPALASIDQYFYRILRTVSQASSCHNRVPTCYRLLRSRHARRSYSTAPPAAPPTSSWPFAFVFDIDGVLLRSVAPLPGAKATLRYLRSQNIPFILLTNGGGKLEAVRAAELSKILSIEIGPEQLIQSHTPYQKLVREYASKNVLALGGRNIGQSARKVLQSYGFKHVITPADILSANPTIYPFASSLMPTYREASEQLPPPQPHASSPFSYIHPTSPVPSTLSTSLQIHLILTLADPTDWAPEIQLLTDLLLSHSGILGTYSPLNGDAAFPNNGYQIDGQPPLYFSNPDLLWATQYHLPRIGQGGFRAALEGTWRAVTGQDLRCTTLGKPGKVAYGAAEQALEVLRSESAKGGTEKKLIEPLKHVYMIGDNPESDIRGANEFKGTTSTKWHSILLKTGVYREAQGPPKYTPEKIVSGVADAVQWALEEQGVKQDVL